MLDREGASLPRVACDCVGVYARSQNTLQTCVDHPDVLMLNLGSQSLPEWGLLTSHLIFLAMYGSLPNPMEASMLPVSFNESGHGCTSTNVPCLASSPLATCSPSSIFCCLLKQSRAACAAGPGGKGSRFMLLGQ